MTALQRKCLSEILSNRDPSFSAARLHISYFQFKEESEEALRQAALVCDYPVARYVHTLTTRQRRKLVQIYYDFLMSDPMF